MKDKKEKNSITGLVIGLIIIIVLLCLMFYYIPNQMSEAIVDEYETNLFTKNGTIISVERVRSGLGIWTYDACEVYFADGTMVAFREQPTDTYALLKPLEDNIVSLTYGQVDVFGVWNKLQNHMILDGVKK